MPDPILSLSTIVTHETIELKSKRFPNGKLYELVNGDDLSPFDHQIILDKQREAVALMTSGKKLTHAQELTLDKILGDVVKILVTGLEPAVLKELSTTLRARILTVWVVKTTEQQGEAPAPKRRTRTTAGSSPNFKRSTVASRRRGSKRQRTS